MEEIIQELLQYEGCFLEQLLQVLDWKLCFLKTITMHAKYTLLSSGPKPFPRILSLQKSTKFWTAADLIL